MATSFVRRPRQRVGVPLSGVLDGVNRVFTTSEKFVHQPAPGLTIQVWDKGRLLTQASGPDPRLGEFVVEESTPGLGFDVVRMVAYTPGVRSVLVASYTAAP